MVITLEDCADILKYFHPGSDLIVIFDNSCRNDIGREYGLNVTKMSSGYGREQQDMNPKNIKQEVSYLGPYE